VTQLTEGEDTAVACPIGVWQYKQSEKKTLSSLRKIAYSRSKDVSGVVALKDLQVAQLWATCEIGFG